MAEHTCEDEALVPPTSRYLEFIVSPPRATRKTPIVGVYSKGRGTILGVLRWYSPWRCYVFQPVGSNVIFNSGCLHDIEAYLTHLMAQRKK